MRHRARPWFPVLTVLALLLAALGVVVAPSARTAAAASAPLAPTPYQGWNTYYGLGGAFDETSVHQVADALVSRGLRDAGYDIVWLDGGWQAAPPRDASGELVADPKKFPSGLHALTDYLHARGLRAGIYTDAGPYDGTHCGLGSYGHYQDDANRFAAWGFDAVKVDFLCGIAHDLDPKTVFTQFSEALRHNSSGRPLLFNLCNPVTSPDWGNYPPEQQSTYSWSYAPAVADSWRTYTDVGFQNSIRYSDVIRNIHANDAHPDSAGPGHWSDPDYLGPQLGMTRDEFRTQLSLWSMAAAPLVIGSDVRKLSDGTVADLTNREVLAVDQDRLGVQGSRIPYDGPGEVWVKRLADGSRAVALSNTSESTTTIRTSAADVGLPASARYALRDLWAHTTRQSAGAITATVRPHDTVLLRVSTTTRTDLAPATDLTTPEPPAAFPGSPLRLVPPGETRRVDVTLRNDALIPLTHLRTRLSLPAGWQATPVGDVADTVPGRGSVHTAWDVTAPPDAAPGDRPLQATATYTWNGENDAAATSTAVAQVPPTPPTAAGRLSDHPWLRATSGWMFAIVDHDVGGGPMSLQHVTQHGIGVASPSQVDFYLGGHCTALDGVVGIDDAVNNVGPEGGTATFQILGDGKVLYDSGLVDRTATKSYDVDLTGVGVLSLDVGDAGDGGYNDRADWAGLDAACS